MLNLEGKTIIYLTNIDSPVSQAGKMGQVKTVRPDISNFAANFLLRGGHIKVIEPSEIHEVRVELGLEKPKPERSRSVRRTISRKDQGSDPIKEEAAGTGGRV